MKKIIILPLLFLGFLSWGQVQIVVQNGAKTEVYSNINTAIANALAGDTLYLPGGGFTISPNIIDKTLHWVGHGHYPSETGATMPTRITSELNITGNCDNSSFEGILFASNLYFGTSTSDEVENVQLKRCRVIGDLRFRYSTSGNPDINFQVSECVLNSITGNHASNCLIEKSLIFNRIHYLVQSQISHNSINVLSSNRILYYCTSCLIIDNVFGCEAGPYGSTSCTFNNNVFSGNLPYSGSGDVNTGSNNIYNVSVGNTYTSITGADNVFSYDNDYHLNTSSTGTRESDGTTGVSIIGTASDNTNAGIYGTTTPYKTIPYYPHINTATIATEAVNDQLGVNINAQAQSR
jgi:hypothetical protein